MEKDISIIIVNYRSWTYLRSCLQSLEALWQSCEIIVVDNCSHDGAISAFQGEFPAITFIESAHNLGFGAGCQLGANRAHGRYLLFLNPDTQANKEAIYSMRGFLEAQPGFGMVSCRQHDKLSKHYLLFPNFFRLFGLIRGIEVYFSKQKFEEKNLGTYHWIEPDWVSASVLMISADNLRKIGGWSKKLWMYYEDPDLCLRLRQTGLKVALLSRERIYHKHGGATRLNIATAAITKTEVTISRHVYINEHFGKIEKVLAHLMLFLNFLVFGSLSFILNSILFFMPKGRLQVLIFLRRWAYYFKVFSSGSWLSEKLITKP